MAHQQNVLKVSFRALELCELKPVGVVATIMEFHGYQTSKRWRKLRASSLVAHNALSHHSINLV